MANDAREPHWYCSELQRELDANRWLQEELLARLAQHALKNDAGYASAETLIRGRLLRPGLMHIYLLRHEPFPNGHLNLEIVGRLCEQTHSDPIVARYYYENYAGERLPRPLIRNVLEGVVSRGSADAIIKALTTLKFATAVACDRGRNNIALQLTPDLFQTVQHWIDIKIRTQRHGR